MKNNCKITVEMTFENVYLGPFADDGWEVKVGLQAFHNVANGLVEILTSQLYSVL